MLLTQRLLESLRNHFLINKDTVQRKKLKPQINKLNVLKITQHTNPTKKTLIKPSNT